MNKVIWFYGNGDPIITWTCTEKDCSDCNTDYSNCKHYTLTVSIEEAVSDLSPVLNCRYGDTVKLERKDPDGSSLEVIEIAVFGKEGKINK